MKKWMLGFVLVGLLAWSQPVSAGEHTAKGLSKKAVKIVHVILDTTEDVLGYLISPVHTLLNYLGDPVEDHS